MTPPILNLDVGWKRVVKFTPRLLDFKARTPVPTEWKAGWDTKPLWTFRRREKSLSPITCATKFHFVTFEIY
jgi:hypothetical protein